jgi:hypothetical protein
MNAPVVRGTDRQTLTYSVVFVRSASARGLRHDLGGSGLCLGNVVGGLLLGKLQDPLNSGT